MLGSRKPWATGWDREPLWNLGVAPAFLAAARRGLAFSEDEHRGVRSGRSDSGNSRGFDVLLTADRPDLTVEQLVEDGSRGYHDLFGEQTRQLSAERLTQFPSWGDESRPVTNAPQQAETGIRSGNAFSPRWIRCLSLEGGSCYRFTLGNRRHIACIVIRPLV